MNSRKLIAARPGRVTVPHPKPDLPIGTLRSISNRGSSLAKQMTSYIALLRKDAGSDYGVEFPDFPGCVTAGATLEEARKMAAEALDLHLTGMQEDRAPIPEPSSLDTIMADPENASAVVFLVETTRRPARSVRINVMLPEDLISEIDQVTTNRSRFLTEAARLKLHSAA